MSDLDHELQDVLATIRSQHDVVPFLERMLDAGSARIVPLPAPMIALLAGSLDYAPPPAGIVTWFQLAAPEGQAELVVYRARADQALYVIAPDRA